jgi:hypothetical protein
MLFCGRWEEVVLLIDSRFSRLLADNQPTAVLSVFVFSQFWLHATCLTAVASTTSSLLRGRYTALTGSRSCKSRQLGAGVFVTVLVLVHISPTLFRVEFVAFHLCLDIVLCLPKYGSLPT